jgi:hypothetical protein
MSGHPNQNACPPAMPCRWRSNRPIDAATRMKWLPRVAGLAVIGLCGTSALAQPLGLQQVLSPSGAAGDAAGNAVAVDADTMVVGVPGHDGPAGTDQGQALVFRWSGNTWTLEASLRAADAAGGDKFGNAVAMVGDTILVGAFQADIAGRADQGAAYVFTRSASGWSQRAKLVASDGAAGDKFGNAVSATGDTLLVCANFATVGTHANAGAGYVFVRAGASWSQQAKLVAADPQAASFLGVSGVVQGDAVVLGAFGADIGTAADRGAAFVFTRSGSAWTQRSRVLDPSGSAGDQFGVSVDLEGSTLVIGAFGDDVDGRVDQGSATVFAFDAATGACSDPMPLRNPDGQAGDRFGLVVDLRGSAIVGGAMGRSAERGAAVLFERQGADWIAAKTLVAPDGVAGDHFGRSVAFATDSVVVGAVDDAVCGRAAQGSLWAFPRLDGRWNEAASVVVDSSGSANESFGNAVAIDGDFMAVGVPLDTVGANSLQGSVVIYRRTAAGWVQEARLVAADGAAGDRFGNVVAMSAGTIAVGSYLADIGGQVDQGAAYVFVRQGDSWVQQAKLVDPDGAADDKFGNAIAAEGDLVAVAASSDAIGASSLQGSAHVFRRDAGAWTRVQRLTASDGAAANYFGSSIAMSRGTLLVGAFFAASAPGVSGGAAYVFDQAGGLWSQTAKLVQADAQAGDFFGVSVAIDGDMAIIGAFSDDRGANVNQGSATLFRRQAGAWVRDALLVAPDGAAGDGFGIGVALLGDTCAVGASSDDVGSVADAGEAHVFRHAGGAWSHQQRLSGWAGACTLESLPWVNASAGVGYAVALSNDDVVATGRGINVGANAAQGALVVMPAPSSGATVATNVASGASFPSLASAVAQAAAGDDILATPGAFGAAGAVDTIGRTVGLRSTGSVRTSVGSTLSLGGGSLLLTPADATCEINGTLQSAAGGTPYVSSGFFLLGSRGRVAAKVGTSLTVIADRVELEGTVRVEPAAHLGLVASSSAACGSMRIDQGASLVVEGPFRLSSSLAAAPDSTLSFSGGLVAAGSLSLANAQLVAPAIVNADDAVMEFSGSVSLFGSLVNHGAFNAFGSSGIFGDFTNAAAAVTTIRSGTLFLFGSLNNQGAILGTLCATCSGMPPGLEVGGNLVLGPASNLILPFPGATVRLGGHFDCAINDPGRLDLAMAHLVLDGGSSEQTVEAMSLDMGVDQSGLSRSHAGGFPIGTLRVAAGSRVALVDRHANVAGVSRGNEAVYVSQLVVEPGAMLRTAGVTIYHEDAVIEGEVDDWSRLVSLRPPCPADVTRDGGVDGSDISAFFAAWEIGEASSDLNGDGAVDGQDVHEFFSHWEAGC